MSDYDDMLMDDFSRNFREMADDGRLGGIFLAVPTGRVLEDDPTFIEVIIYDQSFYAKPCLAFGSYNVPQKEWLEKYVDEVMVWVAFENGNSAHPVYLGVSPADSKVPAKPHDGYYWKSTEFEYSLSDSGKNFSFTANSQNVISYNSTGITLLKGTDVAVKGNELESWLTQLVTAVKSIVTTNGGSLNPGSIAQLENLTAQLSKIKSTKIKIE